MDIGSILTEASTFDQPATAARMFAASGVPVFPCVPSGKRPLTRHGFHDATTEPAQVGSWWRRWPDANIGIPTGAASGLVVVDVDVHPTGTGYAPFRDAHERGLASGWAALVRTASGGLHAYFPSDPSRAQPSWQATRVHIDFRGDGGYIIAPPSRVTRPGGSVRAYVLIVAAGTPSSPVDASRLRDFLDPRPPAAVPRPEGVRRSADAPVLAGWVAARGEGERNRGLFWAACRLAEAGTTPADALDTLGPAAEQAGLGSVEIAATIRSAYRVTHPRSAATPSASGQDTARGHPRRDPVGQVLS